MAEPDGARALIVPVLVARRGDDVGIVVRFLTSILTIDVRTDRRD